MGEHEHDFEQGVDGLLKNPNETRVQSVSPSLRTNSWVVVGGWLRVLDRLGCTPGTLRDHPTVRLASYSPPLLPGLS